MIFIKLLAIYDSYCAAVSQENVSLVISRQLISDLCTNLPSFDSENAKVICNFTLEKLQSRAISFEEQVVLLDSMFLITFHTSWGIFVYHVVSLL